MKRIGYTPSILVLLFLLGACSSSTEKATQTQRETQTAAAVPELLERPAALYYGEEWVKTQDHYHEWKAEIEAPTPEPEALLNMAQLFTQEARVGGEHGHYYPAALDLLDRMLAMDNLSRDLRFRGLSSKAGVLLSQHEFAEAHATGKQALDMNPYNAAIYGVMVDACVELGRYEEAVEYADQMVAIRPDLRSYSRVSYLREIFGKPEAAIEAMEMAVKAGAPGAEGTAWAQLQLGQLYQRYGRPGPAERHYQMILQERPNYPFALGALAELAMERGKYEEAEAILKDACEIIPEFSFYLRLADIYQATDRPREAEAKAEEVLAMLADDVEHGHNMNMEYADLYLHTLDAPEKALNYAKNEYEKRPNNIDVNLLLADIYAELGQAEKAAEHLAKASVTESKNPDLLALRAELGR